MKYMDSFNAKMEQLNAEMEEFWLALMDDKTLKGFLDQLIGLVGVINELLKGGNAFAKVLTAIATTLLSLKSLKMGTFFGELGAPKKVVDKLPTKPEDVVQLASQTGQGQSGFGARIKSGLVTTGALLTSVQDKHNIRMGIEKEIFTADQAALYEQEKAAGGKDMLIGTGSQDKMIKEIFGADSDQYKEYKSTEMKSKGGIGKEAAFTSIMEREGYAVSPVAGTHPGNINKTFDVTKKGMSDSSKQIDQYVKATKKAQLASSGMAAGLQVAASAMMIFSNNTLTAQEKTKLFAGDMVAGLGTALAPLAGPFAPLVLIGSQLAGMAIKMINVEDATQKARDAMNKFNKETAESYKAQRPAIDDLTRRYAELTHYVELTDVEQQELTEVKNRLAELMPSIVLGYDEYNNAIIQSSDTLQKHIAILREKNKEELLSLKGETIKKGSEEKMGALALKGIETKDTSSSQLLIQDKDGVLTSDSQIKKLFPELSDQQRKDLVGQLNTIAKSEISKEQKTKLYNEVLDRFGVSGDISSELDVFGMPTGLSGFKKTELKDQITEADYGNIQEVAMGQEQNFFATLQTMGKSTSQAQEYTRAYGGLMSALTASPEELAEMGMDKESLNQLATDFATMADDEFFLKYQGQLDNIIQKQKDQEAGIKNDLLFLTEEDRTKLTEEQKTELAELNKNFGESVYDFAEEHGLTLDAAAKEMRAAMLKLPVKEQKEQLKILSDAFADFKIPPEFENAEEAFTSFADGVSGIGARVMKDIPNTGTALSLLTQINLEAAKAAEILGEVMDPKSPGSSLITPAEKKRVEGVISQLKYIKVTYAKTSTSESMAALLDEDGAMNTLSRSSADLLTTATVEFNEEAYQDYLGGLPETPEGPAGPRILEDWEKELILKDLLLEYGEQLNEQEEEQLKILIRQKDLNVEQVKIYKDQLALVKKLRGEQEKSALVLTRTRGGGFAFRYSAKAQEQKQQLKYEEFANLYFQAKDAGVPNDVLMIASGLAVIGKHEEAAQLLMQSKTIKEGEMSKTDMSAVKSDLYNFVSGSSLSQEDKDKLISAYGLTPGASTSAGKVYVVKSGDTLGKIAAAHGTTVNDILKKNPSIKDANKISVGQTIALAKGGLVTGSIFANIGEAGKELVLPLERNTEWMDLFARKLNMAGGSSGQVNVTNYITLPNATSDEIKQILSGMSNTTTQWLNKRRSY
jgi:LysM repeat protein